MAAPHETEFLSLDPPSFSTDDDSGSSPFDTLWTEFARSHPRLSPPRTPTRSVGISPSSLARRQMSSADAPQVDLRALEYIAGYDANLECPICHVPFVDPVVLDCDHTFCAGCLEEYRTGGPNTDRSRCPACRSYQLGRSRKASRLIKNMCNDILVRCPHSGCQTTSARGCIAQHALKECPEQELTCPDTECARTTKRKNFVEAQCVHSTHVECECGATIKLGRGEWRRHKDEECPETPAQDSERGSALDNEQSKNSEQNTTCPGAEFGCIDDLPISDLPAHIQTCPFARLAPHLKRQTALLTSLSDQLKMTKLQNEALETSFDRLSQLITTSIQPKLDGLIHLSDPDADVEEIERTDLPSLSPTTPRSHPANTSLLSTHENHQLNDLAFGTSFPNLHHVYSDPLPHDLVPRLSNLESHTTTLESRLQDLDARSSMALMNETLRIREELAHINGAMYSTRAQVQWLLNRERIMGQRDAMAAGGAGMAMRGRVGAPATVPGAGPTTASAGSSQAGPSRGAGSNANAGQQAGPSGQRPSFDRNMSTAWSNVSQGAGLSGSGSNSAATSPIFGAARPSLRRQSGGSSQERVKL